MSLTPMDAEGGSGDRDLARRVALVLRELLDRRQAKQLPSRLSLVVRRRGWPQMGWWGWLLCTQPSRAPA